MNLIHEPYTLEVAEVDWVEKALSTETDGTRAVLSVAALTYYKGAAVLVATDTHRLHVLRLGPVKEEFPTKLIDIRRVLFEARYAKATHVRIAVDLQEVSVGRLGSGKSPTFTGSKIFTPIFDTVQGNYPNIAKVMPERARPICEFFAINSKYLADATLLSRRNGFRTMMLSENAESRPIIFRPREDR
jgi:DNA polymerase III sliding clamp (beta) subunit (PCNA family)